MSPLPQANTEPHREGSPGTMVLPVGKREPEADIQLLQFSGELPGRPILSHITGTTRVISRTRLPGVSEK